LSTIPLIDQGEPAYDGGGRKYGAWSDDRIGSDLGAIPDQSSEFDDAGLDQLTLMGE
jgi:hypothetical protein